jgi:hypothetical protein
VPFDNKKSFFIQKEMKICWCDVRLKENERKSEMKVNSTYVYLAPQYESSAGHAQCSK